MGEVISLVAPELRACFPPPAATAGSTAEVVPLFVTSIPYRQRLAAAMHGHHRALIDLGARIRASEAAGADTGLLRELRAELCARWRHARDQLHRVDAALACNHSSAEAPGEDVQ